MVALPWPYDDEDGEPKGDRALLLEAMDRWEACKKWQAVEDERAREDIKFANGDPRNQWQWPEEVYNRRTSDGEELPCLTINSTRVHNDLIINAMSKQRYGVKIRPVSGEASYESAKIMECIKRRIEYISKASMQYRKVSEHQVDGGIGYILISTDYVSERSFDQDIFLKAARDPTAVYLDPWINESDGSDARFGFEFEVLERREFNRKYPKWRDKVGAAPLDSAFEDWLSDDEVTLVKYWRKSDEKDVLVGFKDQNGDETLKLASEIKDEAGKEIFKALLEAIKEGEIEGQTRKVMRNKVEWFLIAGATIIDRGDWAGKYIPICRCPGREIVIDGVLDRKGHTRPMINAQHMLNYNASVSVETAALAPKAQWIGPARAFEGQEQWKDANRKRYGALMYNDIDDEAPAELQRIESPQRVDPPQISQAYMQGMQDAERQMMMISGQFQAQMGENDTQSAASGKAIGERQQQGDTATYHFPEHQSDMLRFIGMQLLDLIPKIYDTKRTLHIIDEQDEKRWITIDPTLESPVEMLQDAKDDEEAIRLAFNPSLGEYECVSDPGPSYATQREEQWNAFMMIMQQSQWVAACAGDLLMKAGDFPGADELAERIKKEIKALKPYLFDDNASPQSQQAQEQLQRLMALNTELMQKLAMKELALKGKDEKRDIDAARAETERMRAQIEAMSKLQLTPKERAQMQHELMVESHSRQWDIVTQANQAGLDAQSDALGAATDRTNAQHQAGLDMLGAQHEAGIGMQQAAHQAGLDAMGVAHQGSIDRMNETHAAKVAPKPIASMKTKAGGKGKTMAAPRFPSPPIRGARQSPLDGKWYIRHPDTGQHYRIDEKAK